MPVWQLFAPFSWLNDEASTRYVLYVFQNQPAALQVSKQDIDFSCPGSIYVSLILIVSRFLMLMFFPSGRGWRDLLYDNDRAGRKGKKGHALFICQQRSFIACNSVNGFEGLTAAQGHVFQYWAAAWPFCYLTPYTIELQVVESAIGSDKPDIVVGKPLGPGAYFGQMALVNL
jgi:hypothetical protein